MRSHSNKDEVASALTGLVAMMLLTRCFSYGNAQTAGESLTATHSTRPILQLRVAAASFPAEGAEVVPHPPATAGPEFRVVPLWPEPFPEEWLTGEVGGTCVDAHDHVFIVNRRNLTPREEEFTKPAPPVIEFDPDGNIVNSWGDPAVLPSGIHGCYVDHEGNVWIGGMSDGIVQKYAHDGSKLLLQIGKKGVFDTSDGNFDGTAMNSSHTLLNKPASIAVDPANGDVYIADGYGNHRIVVFDRDGRFLRQWGEQGTTAQAAAGLGGVFVKTVHCVVIDNIGLVYVCDRGGDRVEVFDKMGHFKKNIYTQKENKSRKAPPGNGLPPGSAWWVAFSPDPAQKYMYVADGDHERVWVYDHATDQVISSFGRAGHQAGQFTFLHTISVDSKGNIVAGETINGRRFQKFEFQGH